MTMNPPNRDGMDDRDRVDPWQCPPCHFDMPAPPAECNSASDHEYESEWEDEQDEDESESQDEGSESQQATRKGNVICRINKLNICCSGGTANIVFLSPSEPSPLRKSLTPSKREGSSRKKRKAFYCEKIPW